MMRKDLITRIAAVSMATMMAASMIGCSSSNNNTNPKEGTTQSASVVNPVKEMTEEEMTQKTGIDLPMPADAKDVSYSVIESKEENIAQVEFTLDGEKMYLRACMTNITSFDDADGDISGLYYEWTKEEKDMVQNRDAMVRVNKDGAGYIAWLDVVPGILYNLCMEENADVDTLVATADEVFVPMQGEVDGDTVEYADLMEEIYTTKAGSAGSEEKVKAAAMNLMAYVNQNSENITAQNQEALATETLAGMKDQYGDAFAENFGECFEATEEAALAENPDYETDVTFNQVVNAIENALEAME